MVLLSPFYLGSTPFYTVAGSETQQLGGGQIWQAARRWQIGVVVETPAQESALLLAMGGMPLPITLPSGIHLPAGAITPVAIPDPQRPVTLTLEILEIVMEGV